MTVRHLNYIYAPNGLVAIYEQNQVKDSMYYVYTDQLGSLRCITDSIGTVKQRLSFDAWGNRRDPSTSPGFTGHEHLDEVGLINMNGRVYDPMLGMFISPDNYVQAPDFSQNFNRYAYGLNNPLMYIDPSGEKFNFWKALVSIPFGMAALSPGMKWASGDASFGEALGEYAVNGVSMLAGYGIATSGVSMANTLSIVGSSLIRSSGMYAVTGGKSDFTVSFGVGNYNFSNNTWDGIWNWNENSTLENIGYVFGAMANLRDINLLINSTPATLYTEKGDAISHSAIVDKDGNSLMSYGPNDDKIGNGGFKDQIPNAKPFLRGAGRYKKFALALRKSRSDYRVYKDLPVDVTVNKYIVGLVRAIGKILPYQGVTTNCVNMSSLSLWLNGIPNIGLHPYLLYASTWAYSNGFRPDLFSFLLPD